MGDVNTIEKKALQIPLSYGTPQTLDEYQQHLELSKSSLKFNKEQLFVLKNYTMISFFGLFCILTLSIMFDIEKSSLVTLALFGCLGVLSAKESYSSKKNEMERNISRHSERIKELESDIKRVKRTIKKESKKQND